MVIHISNTTQAHHTIQIPSLIRTGVYNSSWHFTLIHIFPILLIQGFIWDQQPLNSDIWDQHPLNSDI